MRDWTQDESEPLPPWLLEAVDALMADFQQPTAINVRIGYNPVGHLWISEPAGWRADFDFRLWGDERGPDLLVTLAHWLQEHFFPESRGAWGQARPACPGHTHAAVADVVTGQAWWICPRDHHQIAPVGHYSH
jgi:hypothetical protein